jgi:hypothetical protein
MDVSTSTALLRAIPTAGRALSTLRSTPYQSLRTLLARESVVVATRGCRVTLTTYVDVLTEQDQEVKVAIQLIAHGWLGYRRVWTQGFLATKSGTRRSLRRRELYEYTWREQLSRC